MKNSLFSIFLFIILLVISCKKEEDIKVLEIEKLSKFNGVI